MRVALTLALFTSLLMSLTGQVTEMESQMSLGNQNAFVMEHENADKKDVQKILEKAIKEFGKVKRNKKADEWYCEECEVPGLPGNTKVYFQVEEGKNMTTSYVYFDNANSFIDSESNASSAADLSKRLQHVGYDVQKHVIGEELKDQENTLKDRNKDLEKLEKKNKNLHEDIEKYRKKIAEAEADIEKNLQSQEDSKIEIEQQKNAVEEVTTRLNAVGKN